MKEIKIALLLFAVAIIAVSGCIEKTTEGQKVTLIEGEPFIITSDKDVTIFAKSIVISEYKKYDGTDTANRTNQPERIILSVNGGRLVLNILDQKALAEGESMQVTVWEGEKRTKTITVQDIFIVEETGKIAANIIIIS